MSPAPLVNHLWQSSCYALLAALLAFALRRNQPKIRFAIWLSASLKFLIPFALLTTLGSAIKLPQHRAAPVAPPAFADAVLQLAQPFPAQIHPSLPAPQPIPWTPILLSLWTLGLAIAFVRCRAWLRIRATLRASSPLDLPIPIPARSAPGLAEPGVAGLFRPVLILPAGLIEHLNPRQFDAILAHELAHVRRRDNLFAALHMLVEAIFWFHPLVWWIGSRLLEEREGACDEEVLRPGHSFANGCDPADYVEAILQVCRCFTESPLPCVSGVTGANVKARLRSILNGNLSQELTTAKKLLLCAAGMAILAGPVVLGALQLDAQQAPRLRVQIPLPAAPQIAPTPTFAAATIVRIEETRWGFPGIQDSHFEFAGWLTTLIQWAYEIPRDFQIVQSPAWFGVRNFQTGEYPGAEWYEVRATLTRPATDPELRQMVQNLLADRLKLRAHRETRQIPIYAIVIGPNGPKLPPPVEPDPCPVTGGECGFPNIGGGVIEARGATMAGFASLLTNNVDRPVIDKTGITAGYNFDLPYEHSGPGWRTGSAIFPAIRALGLELQPRVEPMPVLVIDSVSRP